MAKVVNGTVTFAPGELAETFVKYREQLFIVVFRTMAELLKHVSVQQGIRFREIWNSVTGEFEIGNFDKRKKGDSGVEIQGRIFETFKGNLVQPIDPTAIYKSIWGSNVNNGDALKTTPIVQLIATYLVRKVWERVLENVFEAEHDPTDTKTTKKWFNGFKTIILKDMKGDNYPQQVLISDSKEHNNVFFLDKYKDGDGTIGFTDENAEDILDDFIFSRDGKLLERDTKLFINFLDYHKYCKAYRSNHGSLPYNTAFDKKVMEGAPKVEIVPLTFVPKNFMLLTPKSNAYVLYNQKTQDERYLIEKSLDTHYDVDVIVDAFFGTQFESVDKSVFSCAMVKPEGV